MKFIDQSFLPKNKVSTVVVDGRISDEIRNNLENMGIHIIKTLFCKDLYEGIAYHPDILMHPIKGKDIVVAPNIYTGMKNILEKLGFNVIKGIKVLTRNYPENIAYNIARVSNFAIHNLKYTDRLILKLLEKNEIELIHVKQGYSKCSICIVNDHAVITSDKGIAKAIEKYDMDTLVISPGYIDLYGLDYGFIGGISGLISKNKLAFSGILTQHPDYKRILNFLQSYGVIPIFLSEEKPLDIGSIIPLLELED